MAAEPVGKDDWLEPGVNVLGLGGADSDSEGGGVTPEPVVIETEKFTATAIGMYDMPSLKVLEVISDTGPMQMVKMVNLFSLALMEPERVSDFEVLSFNELQVVLGSWISKSVSVDMYSGKPDGRASDDRLPEGDTGPENA